MKTDSSRSAGILIAAVCFLAPLHAATRYVDAGATGADDGSSWTDAYPTLQDALAAASAGDEIWVAEGTYYPDEGGSAVADDRSSSFALADGVELYGGFPADGSATLLTDRDPAARPTILSGDLLQDDDGTGPTDNAYHVVTGTSVTATTVLDGFTVTAGRADGGITVIASGSGLFLTAASPTVRNCRITGNLAVFGGGLYTTNSSSPAFTNCSFAGNRATTSGGAAFNADIGSSPTFTQCSFTGNRANSGHGGGCFVNGGSPSLISCSFSGNHAGNLGGGLYNGASASLTNSIIWNNRDSTGTGTAASSVSDVNPSSITYAHCLIQGRDPAGTGNLDGTSAANDPLFVLEVDPAAAPTTAGDLRLRAGSPVIDAGDDTANSEATDLSGYPRKVATIDLGAHEQQGVLYVDETVAAGDGLSWATAYDDLQDALSAATEGQEIRIARGTYLPSLERVGGDGRSVSFSLDQDLLLFGGYPTGGGTPDPATHPTVLSGDLTGDDASGGDNSENAYHVLFADGSVSPVTRATVLSGFTITAGNADGTGSDLRGGGMFLRSASPSISRCIIAGNEANQGGGVYHLTHANPTYVNCVFSGNRGTFGGAMTNNDASPGMINCTFSGNQGAAILNANSSGPAFTNCIVWNNSASVSNNASTPTYDHCLIEGLAPGGTSLDGTDPLNDPRFVLEVDPATAPTTGGDLRLLTGSPALDAGDNGANSEALDIAGNSRIQSGTIDLGAYEGFLVTFETLHPGLLKTDDDNGNGHTNYEDYALGADPLTPHDPSYYPMLEGTQLTFGYRDNAVDVFVEFQKSTDLLTWLGMVNGIDYTIQGSSSTGGRTVQTLDLLLAPPADPKYFFREEFFEANP
ncbi:right-handed parallel beta-helix repeat-containing protein [Luteolibacter marinus]|uniref:right-handed parallel beta-helix repeat-containing protein n=1 Tax=Luteolibacter marinus TaxID=2776705 RepID=UPI001865FFE9|nr:right-handed parallel beta-helix repeat-containing protein [Luteolibacter marinus]